MILPYPWNVSCGQDITAKVQIICPYLTEIPLGSEYIISYILGKYGRVIRIDLKSNLIVHCKNSFGISLDN